jgi:formylmethanofuran:tetrahydromethanopterin formyltransferase
MPPSGAGGVIIEAIGVHGLDNIKMVQSDHVRLEHEFEITITKPPTSDPQAKIGLVLEHWPDQEDGRALKVKAVCDGLVKEIGEKLPAVAVKAGDFIVEVNYESGDVLSSKGMVQQMAKSQEVTLKVVRP